MIKCFSYQIATNIDKPKLHPHKMTNCLEVVKVWNCFYIRLEVRTSKYMSTFRPNWPNAAFGLVGVTSFNDVGEDDNNETGWGFIH